MGKRTLLRIRRGIVCEVDEGQVKHIECWWEHITESNALKQKLANPAKKTSERESRLKDLEKRLLPKFRGRILA
jgi:hypothetical protein